jgi:ABC-type uncharacterized transport system auxiliary subunit
MKKLIFILIILAVGVQSCGERALVRHYYILELPAKGTYDPGLTTPVEGVCEILDTKVPPAYAQLRIAVRKKSHEISYYQYHHWAMNPSENLTSLLEDQVKMAQIFSWSQSGFLKQIPDYQIASRVYKLEALDNEDAFYAHLEMGMELIIHASNKTIVTHEFERTQKLNSRDLNLFASELSVIFQEEAQQFTTKIISYFQEKNQSNPVPKTE